MYQVWKYNSKYSILYRGNSGWSVHLPSLVLLILSRQAKKKVNRETRNPLVCPDILRDSLATVVESVARALCTVGEKQYSWLCRERDRDRESVWQIKKEKKNRIYLKQLCVYDAMGVTLWWCACVWIIVFEPRLTGCLRWMRRMYLPLFNVRRPHSSPRAHLISCCLFT